MHKKDRNHQFGLTDFNQSIGRQKNLKNRGGKKTELIPWEEIEVIFLKGRFSRGNKRDYYTATRTVTCRNGEMMQREIGGYIELDTYEGELFHEEAIALNCGRNALAYVLRARKIERLWIPKFSCKSIVQVCEREGVKYAFYSIGMDFFPTEDIVIEREDWVYLINYYSQISNDQLTSIAERFEGKIIVDQAQSFFQMPIEGIDTIYTCRKYFGVPDGAFLYTDKRLQDSFSVDESFMRMEYLLGRYERTAGEFYQEYAKNNEQFSCQPIKIMSKLTKNLLRGVDYKKIQRRREANFSFLNEVFLSINELILSEPPGSFMYPLLVKNGNEIKTRLCERKIYIPTLWPEVLSWCNENEIEYYYASNIIPLPIDQRYDEGVMEYLAQVVCDMLQ